MKTLIIYDTTGTIFSSPITGSYQKPQGQLNYLEIEIPEGRILKGIDTSKIPNIPILEDVPKTDLEKTQDQLLSTQAQLANLQEQILVKENGGK